MSEAAAAAVAAERPVTKPSASGLRAYLNLVSVLAISDFKLRYFGSVLGYFWTLARPLMMFGVLYLVFTHVVRLGSTVHFYAVVILAAIVLWVFFSEATSGAVNSLVNNENLLRRMSFPLSAIPISVECTAALNLLLNLVSVLVFMALSGVPVRASWLLFPLLVLALMVIAVPLVLLLSVLYVRFRDMQHIWDVILQIGFYGTPIIYPIELVPDSFQRFMMFNPVAVIIEQVRHSVIDASAPSAAEAIGGAVWLLVPIGIVAALGVASALVFRREAPRAAELL